MIHAVTPAIREVRKEGPEVPDHLQPQDEFEASLSYGRLCLGKGDRDTWEYFLTGRENAGKVFLPLVNTREGRIIQLAMHTQHFCKKQAMDIEETSKMWKKHWRT